MAVRTDTSQLNWPRWAQALLIALLAVLVAIRLSALADDAAFRAGLVGEVTTIGGAFGANPEAPRFFQRVVAVEPGGPLDKAGVKVGDGIRTNPKRVQIVRHKEGERIAFDLDRGGVRTSGHFTIELARRSAAQRQADYWVALNKLAAMVTALIGCFILWRGWGNKTAMLLGAGMIQLHIVSTTIPAAFGRLGTSDLFLLLIVTMTALNYVLPLFALRLYKESVGTISALASRSVKLFVGYSLVHHVAQFLATVTGTVLPLWSTGLAVSYLNTQLSIGLCVVVLIAAWRNSAGLARNRNAVILFAFCAYLVAAMAGFAILESSFLVNQRTTLDSLAILNLLMAGLIAPGLLAYAVLRHKLFDLGFAVNRTLVYATVGVLVLASFALIEWAIKQAIPKAWYGGSAYFSAGIAVVLYLLFNRIHHWVERVIERLFFRKWQLNEEALRRFVRAAAHVEKPEALAAMFAAELARFTGGAKTAIYARAAEGHYASATGAAIDADDPALAAMRAEQEAVVPGELGSTLDAALALPMMHQALLAGFVLLGPKPAGEDYRPDEIEVLGWAARQVGLDLQAIRVRDLEQQVVTLGARNANLSEILAKAATVDG